MIFNIQRWSLHDGPGIRTTVFLKGCPLRCRWCSNPESWSFTKQQFYLRDQCVDCFNCVEVCPNGANRVQGGKLRYNRDLCTVCGACITTCSAGARESVGDDATVEQILKTITRDAVFYRSSDGGVTFSGGEPFAQPELLRYLVRGCFKAGIQMAVETCGYFNYPNVEDILDYIDDILIDFKHSDPDCHRRLTGVSNERITESS